MKNYLSLHLVVVKNMKDSKSYREISNYIEYIACCIGAFANRFDISNQEAYRYLLRFGGLSFLYEFYDVEHTFSIDDAVDDITKIAQRNGGALYD